jgi:hypothetical protein
MAFDLALSGRTHDLLFTAPGPPPRKPHSDLILIDNAERVAQQIKISLLTFLGEWFLDSRVGTPYLEYILVKNANRGIIESVLRAQITKVPDVRRVTSLTLQVDAVLRRLQVVFEADTQLGIVNLAVALTQEVRSDNRLDPIISGDSGSIDFTGDFVPGDFH